MFGGRSRSLGANCESVFVVQIQQVMAENRVSCQIHDNRNKHVLCLGDDEDVVEGLGPVAINVFNTAVDNLVSEQFVARDRYHIGRMGSAKVDLNSAGSRSRVFV